MNKHNHNGFAIAIAWPETLCKQAGAWYDGLMNSLKISKNNYYKVGHAAVVLINAQTNKCYYFDFGRYHAPYGYGRVRDEITDHDLKVKTFPVIKSNTIENIDVILNELLNNPSCHGNGYLLASYTSVSFEKAYAKAKQMQQRGVIKYGPFEPNGTNCSRFVRSVVLSGKPKFTYQLKLLTPYSVSPTPKTNVLSLLNKLILFPEENTLYKNIAMA
jgi:uncharacterized protein DUF6695|tara:strand:- start:35744 stop:36391 length:648 start_codon:yes stop_codon:yes gene_type:complete